MKRIVLGLLLLFVLVQVDAAQLEPPTRVTASDGDFEDRVEVSWTAVSGAGLYRVYRCTTTGDSCDLIAANLTSLAFGDAGGKAKTIYYYRVKACKHFGGCSKLSTADAGHRGTIFNVSAGQSGSWFDPSHDGEGFSLQILSDTQAAVFWFTYDRDGNQFWITGLGEIDGPRITFSDLISPHGGKFGPGFNPDDVVRQFWGTLEFEFSGCNTAIANYSGPEGFGFDTLNVIPLTSLWGLDCDGDQIPNESTGNGFLNVGFSGAWYDPEHNGEGFVIEVISETRAVVMWFTYDTEGNPAWMSASGSINGSAIQIDDFQITSGAIFGPDFSPDDVKREHWGEAAFSFTSCGQKGFGGSMRYVPPPEFGPQSGQFLYRLTAIADAQCDLLTDTYRVSGVMDVADNIFVDGDVNDPNIPEVSNDLDAQPQKLAAPAKVVGFATAVPTGVKGSRFELGTDEWDTYQLPLQGGETVTLHVSDWIQAQPPANDLDLYLLDDSNKIIDSSENVTQSEWVTAPEAGIYKVAVHVNSGTSKYLLKSGQSTPLGVSKLSSSAAMVKSELIAALQPKNTLTSANDQKALKSQIEIIEKNNALTRINEGVDGEILYGVNSSRIDLLTPHPLTANGIGSIAPENWQVIRVAKELSISSGYRWAGPNYTLEGTAIPRDPHFKDQWHYPLINLPQAWDVTTGSFEVVVAVIDTGIYQHPDLVTNVDYSIGYDFVLNPLTSGDGDGADPDARDPGMLIPQGADYISHGTHVAGTIGASSNNGLGVAGVNWDVTLMPVRVLDIEGFGDCWGVDQGMKWAGGLLNETGQIPDRTADVINMSLGGDLVCSGHQETINRLASKGIVIVAAAGNDSTVLPKYPAALANVISVSATTITDEFAFSYSNFGSTIDVAAPGGDVLVDLNGDGLYDEVLSTIMVIKEGTSEPISDIGLLTGTSMASPHVAGVAALMKSVYPLMGSYDFFSAISSGQITEDLALNGPAIKDSYFGWGRIDARKAVNWALKNSGQPSKPFLTSSISAAEFDSVKESIEFEINKGGFGSIEVVETRVNESWMQLLSSNTDDDGLGTYQIDVDRTGLIDGSYFSWAEIESSDGAIIFISVSMHVGEKVVGDAGFQYAHLKDLSTGLVIEQWVGLVKDGEYQIEFNSVPTGVYYLTVSSDVDKNNFDSDPLVCDPGELCQKYPLKSRPSPIIIEDEHIDLGRFMMSFPDDISGRNIPSAADRP